MRRSDDGAVQDHSKSRRTDQCLLHLWVGQSARHIRNRPMVRVIRELGIALMLCAFGWSLGLLRKMA